VSKFQVKTVDCDLLCIGGGIAGLMSAIRASELGVKVVTADKGNTLHSGSGSSGNDHFQCYIPEFHGQDTKPILEEYLHAPIAKARSSFAQPWLERSFDTVKLWDRWGIPMKYKGRWEFAGHALPGRPRIWLKYAGGNQKEVLTTQALKRGVQIMNRITVFELLKDEETVIGALGFDTWNDEVIVFKAKAVFIGTGGVERLYPSSTPALFTNTPLFPFNTGDGRAMVYRAGGELCNMEYASPWAGPKYYARAGKATWIGVLRTADGSPVGPFITKPDKVYGDITSDSWPSVFDDYMRSGRGPVYMDCTGASDEDIEYMLFWLRHEGNNGLLDHMAEEGIDPRKHAIEFRTYGLGVRGGVLFDVEGRTTVAGLYSAGDEYGGGMANSAIWGWIAGETAAKDLKGRDFGNTRLVQGKIDEKLALLDSIIGREAGATWQEANMALQYIMSEYAGLVRSETLLDQGLRNLLRLKEKAFRTIRAKNGHELGRCLEVLNLLDNGEMVMLCAKERRETRGRQNRTDYPFTNPLLDRILTIKKEDNKPVLMWGGKEL
jgi:succinate dehydrogenase/fumarate reductase flavoprotein subunit